MKITQHAIFSAAAGSGVYAATRSWEMTAATFIVGIFIDLDHIFDYWREYPFSMDISHFFTMCERYRLNKAVLLIHTVELAVPLAIIVYLTRSPWITGLLIGWSVHMVLDHLGNKTNGWTYFMARRIHAGFDIHRIFETEQGGNNG